MGSPPAEDNARALQIICHFLKDLAIISNATIIRMMQVVPGMKFMRLKNFGSGNSFACRLGRAAVVTAHNLSICSVGIAVPLKVLPQSELLYLKTGGLFLNRSGPAKRPSRYGSALAVDSGQKVCHYSGQDCSGQVVAEWNLRRHQRLVSAPAGLLFWNPLRPVIVRLESTNLNAQWAKYFQRNNANQNGIANF